MNNIQKIVFLTFLLTVFTKTQADDLNDDQVLGLCIVAAGNIAEGTIKGLNDRDSIKKAKVTKKAIILARREQGKDPSKIFASEREFNVTNNYFMNLNLSDKKSVFALCYSALPPDLAAKLFEGIED